MATHAYADRVDILSHGPDDVLRHSGLVNFVRGVYDMEIGTVTRRTTDGPPDLITVLRDIGIVEIRRGIAGPNRFEEAIHQELAIPGGPRAAKIVDLDRDGWNDLIVVIRNLNRVLTYHNDSGTFVPGSEMPAGTSPRDLAIADFDGDNEHDVAVINRYSLDVSVLPGCPGDVGFSAHDQIYPVDGEVVDLKVIDLNGDEHDDVLQLHRTSGEVSVWLANDDGSLKPPVFYAIGSQPSGLIVDDLDRDGSLDLMAASLGMGQGSLTARFGDGLGDFGPVVSIAPAEGLGSLFGIRVADFDNDGTPDVAAGFLDCRLAFFRREPDGTFTHSTTHSFLSEARAMAIGDFDRDGDVDLAGASFTGVVAVVENRGDLLTTDDLGKTVYDPGLPGKFGTRDMDAEDINGDGDLDLGIASGDGVMVYEGAEGISFVHQ